MYYCTYFPYSRRSTLSPSHTRLPSSPHHPLPARRLLQQPPQHQEAIQLQRHIIQPSRMHLLQSSTDQETSALQHPARSTQQSTHGLQPGARTTPRPSTLPSTEPIRPSLERAVQCRTSGLHSVVSSVHYGSVPAQNGVLLWTECRSRVGVPFIMPRNDEHTGDRWGAL